MARKKPSDYESKLSDFVGKTVKSITVECSYIRFAFEETDLILCAECNWQSETAEAWVEREETVMEPKVIRKRVDFCSNA